MKSVFLIFILNLTSCNFNKSQDFKFELSGFNQKPNIAYLGVNNRIKINPSPKGNENFNFVAVNGKVTFDNYGYIYRPDKIGQSTINVKIENTEVKSKTSTLEIEILYLPFTFSLNSNHTLHNYSFKISKEEFLKGGFTMESMNANISARAKILSFDLELLNKSKTLFSKSYYNYNRDVDTLLKTDLENLKSGDIIQIENLYYTYLDNISIKYKRILIVIE